MLVELYGAAMFREHGEEPGQLWTEAIHGLTDNQIKRGLKNLAEDALAFPANLGQFVSACKRVPQSPRHVSLPTPPPDSLAVDKAWYFQMIDLLGEQRFRETVGDTRFNYLKNLRAPEEKDSGIFYDENKIMEYTMPQHATRNPNGNPHHITLNDHSVNRRFNESIAEYSTRIGREITLMLYGGLRSDR